MSNHCSHITSAQTIPSRREPIIVMEAEDDSKQSRVLVSMLTALAGRSSSWPLEASAYKLKRCCGKGGSAVVYVAHCIPRDELVSVKVSISPLLQCLTDLTHAVAGPNADRRCSTHILL